MATLDWALDLVDAKERLKTLELETNTAVNAAITLVLSPAAHAEHMRKIPNGVTAYIYFNNVFLIQISGGNEINLSVLEGCEIAYDSGRPRMVRGGHLLDKGVEVHE